MRAHVAAIGAEMESYQVVAHPELAPHPSEAGIKVLKLLATKLK
jgi:hypothetical protein